MLSRSREVKIETGSDAGKTFVVRKMSLHVGDRWANRAILELARSGSTIQGLDLESLKPNVSTGMIDLATVGPMLLRVLGGLDSHHTQQLLDELLDNVRIKVEGSTRAVLFDDSEDDESQGDITCPTTLWKLRIEAIKVNLDFLKAGVTLI